MTCMICVLMNTGCNLRMISNAYFRSVSVQLQSIALDIMPEMGAIECPWKHLERYSVK